MADNVAVTAGSGTTIAADEVVDATLGTAKVQYVKIMNGDLDSTAKLGSTTPFPMNLQQVGGAAVATGNGVSGATVQRVSIASDSTGQIAVAANATATGTAINSQSALTNTKISVKTSAGNLYGYHIYNPGTAVTYVQFFNALTASVTLGTTAPTMVLAIPAGGWADSPTTAPGIAFSTGMVIAATTTATGSTAPTTSLVSNVWYL